MSKFSLTLHQLQQIIKRAEASEEQEDILTFEVKDQRLLITQSDWGHTKEFSIMNKPC